MMIKNSKIRRRKNCKKTKNRRNQLVINKGNYFWTTYKNNWKIKRK